DMAILSKLDAALLTALSGRSVDYEQAILRLMLYGAAVVYVWFHFNAGTAPTGGQKLQLMAFAGFLVVALAIFIATLGWPAPSPPMRILGTISDAGVIPFALFIADDLGPVFASMYLFVSFGNAFRYGPIYARLTQALCVAGFLLVMFAVPWWQEHWSTAVGLQLSLLVLPAYVSALAQRLVEQRAKAEQALDELRGRSRENRPE